MSKHTPGPWHVDCGCIYAACQMDERGRTRQRPLAEVTSDEDHDDHYEKNCRLIAAAPDLLEALKAMLSHTADLDPMQGYRPEEDFSAVKQACAAIAKAEGA